MDIYTYQIGNMANLLPMGIPYYDTTVKSGLWPLAPTWEIVMGHKKGLVTDQQYTDVYWPMMVTRYHWYPEFFEWLISQPVIALGCYCRAGKFCHRHILVKFISQITEVNYRGEL